MGCGQVSWLGLGGGRIVNFMDRTRRYLSGRSTPHTLVVHIGSKDIFAMTKRELCEAVDKLLRGLRQLLPRCRLVWSNILPRLFWYGEEHAKAGEKVRKEVNRQAYKTCKSMQGDNRVIFHKDITGRDHSLYKRKDGVHLSSKGYSIFRHQLQEGLRYFNATPPTAALIGYPPL